MPQRGPRLVWECFWLAFGLCGSALAETWATKAADELKLPSGLRISYAYQYSRGLKGAPVRTGNSVIGLTGSGNLLCWELPSWKLTRDLIASPEAVCLGGGDGEEVYVGLVNGDVFRLDPATLQGTAIGHLPEKAVWVGGCTRGGTRKELAITGQASYGLPGGKLALSPPKLHDLIAGKVYDLPDAVDTVFVDTKLRVWCAVSRGEFGGWIGYLDLATGKSVVAAKESAHGFVELPDGQVWAYGGLTHLSTMSTWIGRVDSGTYQPLYTSQTLVNGLMEGEKLDVSRPLGDVHWILCEPGGRTVLVHSVGSVVRWPRELPDEKKEVLLEFESLPDLYRADLRLSKWEVVKELPDYAKQRLPLEPPRRRDAWEYPLGRPLMTEDRALLMACLGAGKAFRLVGGLPILPERKVPAQRDGRASDSECRLIRADSSEVVTLHADARVNGSRDEEVCWLVRWRQWRPVSIQRTTGHWYEYPVLITPDGEVWGVVWHSNTGESKLQHLIGGTWREVAAAPHHWYGPTAIVSAGGPPWALFYCASVKGRGVESIWRLAYGPRGADPRMTPAGGGKVEAPPELVYDAVPWVPGKTLVAASQGVRLYNVVADVYEPAPFDLPRGKVTTLCRDGLGRAWMAGDGVWVTEAGGRGCRSLDSVPVLCPGAVQVLVADPEHKDGVIAALGNRGAMFLCAEEPKAP